MVWFVIKQTLSKLLNVWNLIIIGHIIGSNFNTLFVNFSWWHPHLAPSLPVQRVEAELGGVIMQMFKSEEMDE